MPYVSLQDQGYYAPSEQIQNAAAQVLAQQQIRQRIAQQQQAFPIEQQQRQAAADEATARAGALPQSITDEAQQRLLRNQGLDTENQTRALELKYESETDPIKKAELAEQLKTAQLKNVPTDSDTTSDVDANGNITEKTNFTRGGQPAGSTSKVIRGNRPPRDGKMLPSFSTDPTTGEKTFTGSFDPTTGNFSPATSSAPVADTVTDRLVNKYYNADGTPKMGGGFLGVHQHTLISQPANASDAVALRKLRADPDKIQKYGLQDTLQPLQGNPGPAPAAPAMAAAAPQAAQDTNPAPSGALSAPAAPQASAPMTDTPPISRAVSAPQTAPAASASASPRKFKDVQVGEKFPVGGKFYMKTGDTTAVPL